MDFFQPSFFHRNLGGKVRVVKKSTATKCPSEKRCEIPTPCKGDQVRWSCLMFCWCNWGVFELGPWKKPFKKLRNVKTKGDFFSSCCRFWWFFRRWNLFFFESTETLLIWAVLIMMSIQEQFGWPFFCRKWLANEKQGGGWAPTFLITEMMVIKTFFVMLK